MKNILRTTVVCIVGILSALHGTHLFVNSAHASGSVMREDSTVAAIPSHGHVVIAYYLYTNPRCDACLKIDALDTDMPEYEHFVNDFELEMKSLVLVEIQDGKQLRWKNCIEVWDLLEDKNSFWAYVQKEVKAYLGNN